MLGPRLFLRRSSTENRRSKDVQIELVFIDLVVVVQASLIPVQFVMVVKKGANYDYGYERIFSKSGNA